MSATGPGYAVIRDCGNSLLFRSVFLVVFHECGPGVLDHAASGISVAPGPPAVYPLDESAVNSVNLLLLDRPEPFGRHEEHLRSLEAVVFVRCGYDGAVALSGFADHHAETSHVLLAGGKHGRIIVKSQPEVSRHLYGHRCAAAGPGVYVDCGFVRTVGFVLELAVDTENYVVHVVVAAVVIAIILGKIVLDTEQTQSAPAVTHEGCPVFCVTGAVCHDRIVAAGSLMGVVVVDGVADVAVHHRTRECYAPVVDDCALTYIAITVKGILTAADDEKADIGALGEFIRSAGAGFETSVGVKLIGSVVNKLIAGRAETRHKGAVGIFAVLGLLHKIGEMAPLKKSGIYIYANRKITL